MYIQYLLYVGLATSTLATVVTGHQGRRYRRQNGRVPSGTITDCTYFVNAHTGDTCTSIATERGITQAQFLKYNPSVELNCSALVIGDSYCVEENFGNGPAAPSTTLTSITATSVTSSKNASATTAVGHSPTQPGTVANCKAFYKVVSGDFCQKIVDTYGTFTLSDFYSWNPAVGANCGGLQLGYYVCVGVPGSISTRDSVTTNGGPTRPSPTQAGIISTCTTYYKAVSGDTCEVVANKYGTFNVAQFESWNPAVGPTCNQLFLGYYYCVGIPGTPKSPTSASGSTPSGPTPTQAGIVSNCNKWYKAVSGDTCQVVTDKYGTFTVATFEAWNPAVGVTCNQLFLGYYYCVGTTTSPTTTTAPPPPTGPQPQQPGIVKNCNKHYLVRTGDTCALVESKQGVTSTNFFNWNKGIKSDCSNLFLGYYVCVGVP